MNQKILQKNRQPKYIKILKDIFLGEKHIYENWYARVSTTDQELQSQIDLLKKEGCDKIYTEKVSGASSHREELQKAISFLRKGNTLVVTKLDRLGRTVKQLIDLIAHFNKKEIGFVSLHDSINTSTPNGRFFFHIMASFAELERELIRERTKIGLDSARSRGKLSGRPALHKDDKKEIAYQMFMEKPYQSVSDITKEMNMKSYALVSTIDQNLDSQFLFGGKSDCRSFPHSGVL